MLNVPEHSQQNTFTRVSFLINIVGILERWDLGTWDSGFGIHMWDQRTRTLHLGPFTWEPVSGTHRRDPEPGTFTWDPAPVTLQLGHFIWARHLICGNRDPIPLRGTQDPYLGTTTLIQLSFNVQFSSVA